VLVPEIGSERVGRKKFAAAGWITPPRVVTEISPELPWPQLEQAAGSPKRSSRAGGLGPKAAYVVCDLQIVRRGIDVSDAAGGGRRQKVTRRDRHVLVNWRSIVKFA